MATIRFTEQDRDDRGFVKVPTPSQEPRSLADLLPTPQSIQIDAQRPAQQRAAPKAEQIGMALAALVAVGFLIYRFGFGGDAAPVAPPRAPAATQTSGDAISAPSPIPVVMLPAYSAPDVPLGRIEATRAITPVAHFGQDWIQADVSGSGRIWLRASDWPQLTIVGPDLAPPTPAPLQIAATTAPAPPPCAEAGVIGKMVQVCGDDSLESLQAQAKAKWIEQYGGNIGIISTPSPQIRSTP